MSQSRPWSQWRSNRAKGELRFFFLFISYNYCYLFICLFLYFRLFDLICLFRIIYLSISCYYLSFIFISYCFLNLFACLCPCFYPFPPPVTRKTRVTRTWQASSPKLNIGRGSSFYDAGWLFFQSRFFVCLFFFLYIFFQSYTERGREKPLGFDGG